MKKLFYTTRLFVALFLLTAMAMSAQERNPENSAKMLTDTLKTKLSLNDEQYKQAYSANLEFLNAAKALKDSEDRRMEKAKKLKMLAEKRDAEMKSFLSADQYKQYLLIKEENKEKIKERRASRN